MIKLSMPFLGKDINQAIALDDYQGLEATIFNREDLNEPTWTRVWGNIEAIRHHQPELPITFHFPVNDSDYVDDTFVKNRVIESLQRANDLNLKGVVVHSNRIRLIPCWSSINLQEERLKVIDTLVYIREKTTGCSPWLSLENMPVMDNYGKEIDPLFCFPDDFRDLGGTNLGIVWDVCHYTSTLANMSQVFSGNHKKEYYPNAQKTDYFDFLSLDSRIKHWHFSAFIGISNPDDGSSCKEGVIPTESELGENIYAESLLKIISLNNSERFMVLEIQEQDYKSRINFKKTAEWIRNNELK